MSFAQLATSITTAVSSALSGTKKFSPTGLAGVRSTINKLRARLALSPISSNDPKKIEAAIKATAAAAQRSSTVPKIVVGALLAVAAVWASKREDNKRNTHSRAASRQEPSKRIASITIRYERQPNVPTRQNATRNTSKMTGIRSNGIFQANGIFPAYDPGENQTTQRSRIYRHTLARHYIAKARKAAQT